MTSTPSRSSRDNAEHYAWGDGCDGWHLVRAASLGVIEERMPSGTAEVRHWHNVTLQFFYVLTGQLDRENIAEFLVISAPPVGQDRVSA